MQRQSHRLDSGRFLENIRLRLREDYRCTLEEASTWQLHNALSRAVMDLIAGDWRASEDARSHARRAGYLSAEFLVGRAVYWTRCAR